MIFVCVGLTIAALLGIVYLTRSRKKTENAPQSDAPTVKPKVAFIPPRSTYRQVESAAPQQTSSSDDLLDTMVKVDLAESVIDSLTSVDTPSFDIPSVDTSSSDFGGFDGGSSGGGGADGSW